MEEETKQFKQLLDKLPHLSEGEKVIACLLYLVADEEKRLEMVEFYKNQYEKHEQLVKDYQDKVNRAREELLKKLNQAAGEE